jgi:hypothetical protein
MLLFDGLGRARSFSARYRRPLTIAAAILFVAGSFWSLSSLHLQFAELRIVPALLLLLLFGPISVVYGALGLLLLGSCGKVPLNLGKALRIDACAQLAEALPLPGGAIVRSGALIRAGAKPLESSALVLASALLWISIASAGTGAVMLPLASLPAIALLLGGVALGSTAAWWLARKAGPRTMGLMLLHRCAGLLINAARLKCAFAILAVTLPLPRCLPFALATIAGSAASIAPAGLGVSESLGALVASSLSVAAPAAFLAVALNRLLALLSAGLFVLGSQTFVPQPKDDRREQPRTA